MTIEKVCFIELSDVSELRIACRKCGSATTIPIEDVSRVTPLIERVCVGCGEPSGVKQETTEWTKILGFIDSLGSANEALKGRNIKLSLRVDCDVTQSRSEKSEPER
jgi:hypothetical protein